MSSKMVYLGTHWLPVQLKNAEAGDIDFSVGVAPVAHNATVYHVVQVLPCYHILIS